MQKVPLVCQECHHSDTMERTSRFESRPTQAYSYHYYLPITAYMGENWMTELQVLNYLRRNKAARCQIIRSIRQAGIIETRIFFLTHEHFDVPLVLPCCSSEHNIKEIVDTRLGTIALIMGIDYDTLVKKL